MSLVPAIRAVSPHMTPEDAVAWAEAFAAPMLANRITTPQRIAAFLGQCAVETSGFAVLSENLHYSAKSLLRMWPAHFSAVDAIAYAYQPDRIANRAYANRLGNGDEASGDGWAWRGRGCLQTTGKSAYVHVAGMLGMSPEKLAAYMETKLGAAAVATWDFAALGCNAHADGWQITLMSERINGSDLARTERIAACNAALHALQSAPVAAPAPKPAPAPVHAAPPPPPTHPKALHDMTADELDQLYNPGVKFTS